MYMLIVLSQIGSCSNQERNIVLLILLQGNSSLSIFFIPLQNLVTSVYMPDCLSVVVVPNTINFPSHPLYA